MIELRGGFTTSDPRLDRIPEKDPASLEYPVMRKLGRTAPRAPRSRTWPCPVFLDQGSEGACTGFSRAHNLAASPNPWRVDEAMARSIYLRARQLDEWPGEAYDGSSVLGAVKAAQEMGAVTEYHWAFTLEEVILGLGYVGPATVGCNWYHGMADTDVSGYIHPTGSLDGGHAIMIHAVRCVPGGNGPMGLNLDRSYVVWHNSWGPAWGVGGRAKMSLREFDKVRLEQAEVCFSTDKKQ